MNVNNLHGGVVSNGGPFSSKLLSFKDVFCNKPSNSMNSNLPMDGAYILKKSKDVLKLEVSKLDIKDFLEVFMMDIRDLLSLYKSFLIICRFKGVWSFTPKLYQWIYSN